MRMEECMCCSIFDCFVHFFLHPNGEANRKGGYGGERVDE